MARASYHALEYGQSMHAMQRLLDLKGKMADPGNPGLDPACLRGLTKAVCQSLREADDLAEERTRGQLKGSAAGGTEDAGADAGSSVDSGLGIVGVGEGDAVAAMNRLGDALNAGVDLGEDSGDEDGGRAGAV